MKMQYYIQYHIVYYVEHHHHKYCMNFLLYLLAVNVRASDSTPSLLALMHSNMLQSAIISIEEGEKGKEREKEDKEKEKEKERKKHGYNNNSNNNSNSNNNNNNSSNSNSSSSRSNMDNSSALSHMLTSSSFSFQDAHSLPAEIQEVSLSEILKLSKSLMLFLPQKMWTI